MMELFILTLMNWDAWDGEWESKEIGYFESRIECSKAKKEIESKYTKAFCTVDKKKEEK